jgi:hypothetical protein
VTGFPCLVRWVSGSGEARYGLGHPLVDRYLEFVAGRARPNTLRAVAFDLKTFFTVVAKDAVELLRFFDKMTPAGPAAGLSPSLADFGDAEAAEAGAATGGRLPAAGPQAIPPVQAIRIPPVQAIGIPPVQAPEIKVPEITADAEQAERP